MNKQLINTLLRVFHSEETRFESGKGLREFCQTYNIGLFKGASLLFNERDKEEIAQVLKGRMGIDASTTFPDSWDGLTRSESLNLGKNEKLVGGVVGEGRLQVKALRGRKLSVCGEQWALPDRAELGLDLAAVLESPISHHSILLVENKQTFHEIWRVQERLLSGVYETNPLVVFRGDAEGGARADAVNHLIASVDIPVFAFVDYDPAGMVIAGALPRLDKVVAPDLGELGRLLDTYGLSDRFMDQLAAAKLSLERLRSDPVIGPIWNVILSTGKGLPQEFFHSTSNCRLA